MSDSLNALTPALSQSTGRGGKIGSAVNVLGWAIFLGASWTWCIGMYLPVMLVRDYGIWGFVVFAVPNVVGAAAMSLVLPDAEASRELVAKHKIACYCFSFVTLLFHAYFLGWMVLGVLGKLTPGEIWITPLLFWVIAFSRVGRVFLGMVALTVSVTIACLLWRSGFIPHLPNFPDPSPDLIGIGAVCGFGLMLCPYLDLTFHEARQATSPREGQIAFHLGFYVFFFAMILFTLAYSGWFAPPWKVLGPFLVLALSVHFLVQISLKFALHNQVSWPLILKVAAWVAIVFAVCFGWVYGNVLKPAILRPNGVYISDSLLQGESIYRLFMSFYGLIFPAYVWICIFRRGSWKTWAISVAIVTPMYWMGFIERQTIWLLPGVAVVLLAGFWRPKIMTETAP